LEALAEVIAARVSTAKPAARRYRVISPPAPTRFDQITRDCCLRRIRYLSRAYQLQWLVDQETFNHPGVESLDDDDLAELLSDMERARECVSEGVAFCEAGLVRDHTDRLGSGQGRSNE
jgi:hypothetical protein